ncbi:MAG TPA: hypothetical protein VFE33_08610 [Thermoanaerobaculia bacterium]|nr:hypothetical protein [Thermoanaerobaculia bacterium]
MTTTEPLRYTETEVRSYLPSGWDLVGNAEGSWDAKKQTWRATIIDNVEFDWPVAVGADEAAKHGRLEALRQAFDRVYRERLG